MIFNLDFSHESNKDSDDIIINHIDLRNILLLRWN